MFAETSPNLPKAKAGTDLVVRPRCVIKFDLESRQTGLAVVRTEERAHHHTLFFVNLVHRVQSIRERLNARRVFRRARRSRNLRYRAPRFLNRTRPNGWLPPSLRHRVDTASAWVSKLIRLAPVTGLAEELVKFDAQRLQNPKS